VAYVEGLIQERAGEPKVMKTKKKILLWLRGEWSYLENGSWYRGEIYGWIGPLPYLDLEIEE
jgi:hypothetical protein